MSGQLLQLLIFAAVAFVIINKLISVLGATSEDDPASDVSRRSKPRGYAKTSDRFAKNMVDVTDTGKSKGNVFGFKKAKLFDYDSSHKDLIMHENLDEVRSGIVEVAEAMPEFNLPKFMKGSRAAFKMIIGMLTDKVLNFEKIETLVDKRYVEKFIEKAESYKKIKAKTDKVEAKIAEVYTFGNNVFIKVDFKIKGSGAASLHEEWTFTKSTLTDSPAWFLSNVD